MTVIGDVEVITTGEFDDLGITHHIVVARVSHALLLEYTATIKAKQANWFDDYDEYLKYCREQSEKRHEFNRKLLACFDIDIDDEKYSCNVTQVLTDLFTILAMEKKEAKT